MYTVILCWVMHNMLISAGENVTYSFSQISQCSYSCFFLLTAIHLFHYFIVSNLAVQYLVDVNMGGAGHTNYGTAIA